MYDAPNIEALAPLDAEGDVDWRVSIVDEMCRSISGSRECSTKPAEYGGFRRGKMILMMPQNVPRTLSSPSLNGTPRSPISFL